MRMKQKVMTAVYNNNNRVKCKQANWAILQANLSANQANPGTTRPGTCRRLFLST